MKYYRNKSASNNFISDLNRTKSNLRADSLSLLHTLPHPQLNLTPQSSQLQNIRRRNGVKIKQVKKWSASQVKGSICNLHPLPW